LEKVIDFIKKLGNIQGLWISSEITDDSTLTQLLSYMNMLEVKENRKVRGIVAAEGFTRKLKQATIGLSNIKLVKIHPENHHRKSRKHLNLNQTFNGSTPSLTVVIGLKKVARIQSTTYVSTVFSNQQMFHLN